MKYKTIGILGGMGPEATAKLYIQIIRIFQQEYGAKYDADFPEMIMVNLPIPDVVDSPTAEKEVRSMLVEGVKKLQRTGASFIAIPCNTVSYYLKEMQEAVSIPILSILEETAKEVQKLGVGIVGIIGTEVTISKNIFGKVLGNLKLVAPDATQQKATTEIIMNILAGKKEAKDKRFLLQLIRKLKDLGAEKVILGCTELPLLVKNNSDTIDTINVLARATVREATKFGGMKND